MSSLFLVSTQEVLFFKRKTDKRGARDVTGELLSTSIQSLNTALVYNFCLFPSLFLQTRNRRSALFGVGGLSKLILLWYFERQLDGEFYI